MIFSLLTLLFPASVHATGQNWQILAEERSPVAKRLLTWFYVTETNISASPQELIRFTRENPGWPKLHMFRDRIEDDISSLPIHTAAEWFDQNPPKTADGIKAYMAILQKLGQGDKAKAALVKFWPEADLDRKETAALAQQYKLQFFPTAHIDRLDRLLWDQRYQEAEYMLPLVDGEHNKLAQARIALGRMSSKAGKLLAAVPIAMQNDPGLLYDRLKWRRQLNKDADAFALLKKLPEHPPYPEMWWKERNILARRAMEDGDYARAYKIVQAHGMTSGAEYSQAEWLLGWLCLRFLHQPDKAYQHFDHFYQAVTSAVSRSRAAYWLARAAEKLQKSDSAGNWDALAAQFPSTFYGQLSHEKIHGAATTAQFPDDQTTTETRRDFEKKEMVRVIRLLHNHELMIYADVFFIKLLDSVKTRPDFVMIARLARETNRLRFAVEANKQLQQKIGEFMFREGYPLLPSLPLNKPERALVHAIVYRESMFDAEAASSAGARGLMQLMPATARQVSRSVGKKFTVDKLTDNPGYNIELGSTYLQKLLENYDGSYPLAIAAYNAGPGNVGKWIREFGDPRNGKTDIVDWIELIPIYETRNYIQRVMESYYMYKLRFSESPQTVLSKNE